MVLKYNVKIEHFKISLFWDKKCIFRVNNKNKKRSFSLDKLNLIADINWLNDQWVEFRKEVVIWGKDRAVHAKDIVITERLIGE